MVVGNDPKINASLFAPGYSIAAVIANEFTEATGDLYLSALIELGLVLFALTIVINGVARLLVMSTDRKGNSDAPASIAPRKPSNAMMLTLTGAVHACSRRGSCSSSSATCSCTARKSLSLELLHQAADAGRRDRRRHGQRHRGQRQAAAAGDRWSACRSDFWAACYLAEYSGSTFAFVVRYVTDLLNGVPSIVIGIFAYTMIVLPQKHFSTLAGGLALGIMMIPIAMRSTEEFLRACRTRCARARWRWARRRRSRSSRW